MTKIHLLNIEIHLPVVIPNNQTEFYSPYNLIMKEIFEGLKSHGFKPIDNSYCGGGFFLFRGSGNYLFSNASDSMVIRRVKHPEDYKPRFLFESWIDESDITFTINDNGLGIKHAEITSKYPYHQYGVKDGRGKGLSLCRLNISGLSGQMIEKIGNYNATFGFQVPLASLEKIIF